MILLFVVLNFQIVKSSKIPYGATFCFVPFIENLNSKIRKDRVAQRNAYYGKKNVQIFFKLIISKKKSSHLL